MLSRVLSGSILGVEAFGVEVEVDVAVGLPAFSIVGLPDAAIQESRERVRAGISNSGRDFPLKRITVNLAPADVRKEGPAFDLPIALAILAATGQLKSDGLRDCLVAGELSLTGEVRRINGALLLASAARRLGKSTLVLPRPNAAEAALIQGVRVVPVECLQEAAGFFEGRLDVEEVFGEVAGSGLKSTAGSATATAWYDFSDIKGQAHAKRALEIAAAGGHNLLMMGPPGAGKTMLARRLPSILPGLSADEALDITKIYSVAGRLAADRPLIVERPFRAPHHTISHAGLVGGGQFPRPGEISLSHHGVLFLDELPEFGKSVLEVLRQPLEDGTVTIARASGSLTYPADFTLIAAMNPCQCGFLGDQIRPCLCPSGKIQQYRAKISGPLLDRIDLHVEVPRLTKRELTESRTGEPSRRIKERVERARELQRARFNGSASVPASATAGQTAATPRHHSAQSVNARMSGRQLRCFCRLSPAAARLLEAAIDQLGLSGRAYDRILKVARTIADLEGGGSLEAAHIAEAVQYRVLDREREFA